MKYPYIVNHNGKYYKTGEEVHIDEGNETNEVNPVSSTSKAARRKTEQKGE